MGFGSVLSISLACVIGGCYFDCTKKDLLIYDLKSSAHVGVTVE